MEIDTGHDLGDFIVQFVADPLSFFLLGGQNLMRQVLQLLLHVLGLFQKETVVLLTLFEGLLCSTPLRDLVFQLPILVSQRLTTLMQCLIQFNQLKVGLHGAAMCFFYPYK